MTAPDRLPPEPEENLVLRFLRRLFGALNALATHDRRLDEIERELAAINQRLDAPKN